MNKVMKFLKRYFSLLPPPVQIKCHSMYTLMPNGPMKKGSLGLLLYRRLIDIYKHVDYEDSPDKESLLASIGANYHQQAEQAWHAFLAEIGENGD